MNFTQLFGALFGALLLITILAWLLTREFFRDVSQIRESLQWIAYAQRRAVEEPVTPAAAPQTQPQAAAEPQPKPTMISQFGRE